MANLRTRREQELLAPDVTRGAYFFLDVVPHPSGPVRVALGGRETCGENYNVDRANYPFATLEFVAEGTGTIRYKRGDVLMVGPGTLFAHGQGVDIRIATGRGAELVKYFLCFTGRGARKFVGKHAPVFGKLANVAHHSEIRELFELLLREGARHTVFTRRICDELVRVMLLKVSEARRHRREVRQSPAREKFLRCKALIDERGVSFNSLEEIAAALHADASGLSRLFRRFQGVSPYQYLLRHKMNLAAQDLIRSGGFVKEVAARAGYPDP
ncbi:MAG: helix-turn-helix domain-containing protein, partial [Opitutus sp.]